MAKKKPTPPKQRPRTLRRRQQRAMPAPKSRRNLLTLGRDWATTLAHSTPPTAPPWKALPWILLLAFVARASIALHSDFLLHPDEIMQYLEPAHRLAFGHGMVLWEYFYGGRAWLLPGLIGGVLWLFKVTGFGQVIWYVDGVKLFFCAISLGIPAAMYAFARRHFDETAARIALIAGAFWYELVGFAHKPMAEFFTTVILVILLAMCVRPTANRPLAIWTAAALAVLVVALRLQYAPLAALLLGVVWLRSDKKWHLTMAATACLLAVGVFDAVTWGGGLFHSYLTNLHFNFTYPFAALPHVMPPYQFVWWLLLASGGVSVLCMAAALLAKERWRRYGLVFMMLAVLLVFHSLQTHKEYRFIFAALPLWLLLGADLLARLFARLPGRRVQVALAAGAAVMFVGVGIGGLMNALPYQHQVTRNPFTGADTHNKFLPRLHPQVVPMMAAYRYLAQAPGVTAVWHRERGAASIPGYYYLHRKIPLYDHASGAKLVAKNQQLVHSSISHIVSEFDDFKPPDYALIKTFGQLNIWQRNDATSPVRQWQTFSPHYILSGAQEIMRQSSREYPTPPPNWGITFVE